MAKKILGLMVIVLFLVLLLPGVFATCTNGVNMSSTGNLFVNNTTTCSNRSIYVTDGNLTIGSAGNLTFQNVTLQFNATGSYVPGFFAGTGSVFSARNSTFTTNDTVTPVNYSMYFFDGANANIADSLIEYANNNETNSVGLIIAGNTTYVTITNTTFSNCNDSSISVGNGASTYLNNLTLANSNIGIVINNATASLHNSTITPTQFYAGLVNNGNLSTYGTYINNSMVSIDSGDSVLQVMYYVQVYVNTSGANSRHVSGADTEILIESTSLWNNTTSSVGLTSINQYLLQAQNSSSSNFSRINFNVTANKSTGGYNYSNYTIFNITSNRVGSNAIVVTMDYPNPVIIIESNESSLNVPLQDRGIVELWLNNSGNKISNISLSDNGTGGWRFDYYSANTSFDGASNRFNNLSVFDNESVYLRIEPPSDAVIGKTYSFKITANATPHNSSGIYNVSNVIVNVTVGSQLNWGSIIQNATSFLEGRHTNGVWNSSNFTSAWALWALKSTHESNLSIYNETLHHFNDTQDPNGYWTDSSGNNSTTAMTIIAHKKSGYSNTEYSNLTKAAEYLQEHVNDTGIGSVFNRSMMLIAIYEAGITIEDSTEDALKNLTDWQSANGSWNNNIRDTALSLWALSAADEGAYAVNKTAAGDWLRNIQNLDGQFGSGTNRDQAIVILALLEEGSPETWTVDRDQNDSTTHDRYQGSIERAITWLMNQRDITTDGWGDSPADNLQTAVALSALSGSSNYASVSGQITGTGAADGDYIENETVQFSAGSNTYTTSTNGTGHYVINLPADDYAVSLDSTIYYLNDTYYANLSSGQNLVLNMGALPKIKLTAAYGASGYIEGGSGSRAEGTSINIGISNATYVYSSIQLSNTSTYNISSSPSNSNFNKSGNLNESAAFVETIKLPTVSENTDYIISLTVSDGNSSITETINLTVTDNDTTTNGNGNGAGGGGASAYGLAITEYNKQMTLSQGETTTTQLVARNTGLTKLEKVSLELVGIESAWYETTDSETGSTSVDLATGEVVTFDIKFTIPNNAQAKTYPATWRVRDSAGNAMGERIMNLTILEVWTETTISDLEVNLDTANVSFAEVSERVENLKAKGNATELAENLEEINQLIQTARTKYADGDYSGAQEALDEANRLISELNADLDSLEALPFIGISLGRLGAAVFVIIIAAFAGILVWYKFMRLVPISEIKNYADRFSEGARVEGVVKSITDTKKGKVFFIKDHTGSLHVRYPYYTTVNEGNMIRAQGVVKSHKGKVYMDAISIHRVSVTGRHTGDMFTQLKKKLNSVKNKFEHLKR